MFGPPRLKWRMELGCSSDHEASSKLTDTRMTCCGSNFSANLAWCSRQRSGHPNHPSVCRCCWRMGSADLCKEPFARLSCCVRRAISQAPGQHLEYCTLPSKASAKATRGQRAVHAQARYRQASIPWMLSCMGMNMLQSLKTWCQQVAETSRQGLCQILGQERLHGW